MLFFMIFITIMRNGHFFVLFTLVLFSSCSYHKNEGSSVEELSLSMNNVLESVKLSDIASSVKCISLETNDSLLIGDIVKVVQTEEFIYVADRNALFKFDNNGTVVTSLRKSGPGSDEYTNISDFQVASDGTIWLLSRNDRALYQYGENNIMKEKVKFDCWVSNICLISPNKMLLYVGNEVDGGYGKQVLQLDLMTKETSDGYLSIDEKKAKFLHIHSENYFSGGSQSFNRYFFQIFNDTVYEVSSDGALSSSFYVNIANRNIPASFFDTEYANVMDFFQNLSKNSYAYGTKLFAEYEDFYLFSFYQLGESYLSMLPKDKEKSECTFKNIKEDTNLLGYTFNFNDLNFYIQENNNLIIPLMNQDVLKYVEDKYGENEVVKLKERFNIVSEDQNPILLCVELKPL